MRGTGTMSSPISVDTDDESETEVINELIQTSYHSTPMESPIEGPPGIDSEGSPIPRSPSTPVPTEEPQIIHSEDRPYSQPGGSPWRGTKRQRSESVTSRGSTPGDDAPINHEGALLAMDGPSNGLPQESRKAKKRKRNAEKKKEQYLLRLARLQHAPNLEPQYPDHITPLAAGENPFQFLPNFPPQTPNLINPLAASRGPFQLLPNFHQQLLNGDFAFPAGFPAQGPHISWMANPSMPPNQMGHYGDPIMHTTWGPQSHIPQADRPLTMMSPTTAPPISANLDAQSIPLRPLAKIGMSTDEDPNDRHGLFKISESDVDKDGARYIPTMACTLVLENLPKPHKHQEYVTKWARDACGARPAKVLIDPSGGKALVEFASSEAARTAWNSPQLGAALKGLKSHLLKGRPREDLIRAYWYRLDGISAGVGELEEGEIEVSGHKEPERPSKRQKKKLDQERRGKDREKVRYRESAGLASHRAPYPSASTSYNGLPQRPHQFPPPPHSHPHLPPAPLTLNGLRTAATTLDGDDMDIESPDGSIQLDPSSSTLNSGAAPFVPSSRTFSEPQAMKISPTGSVYPRRTFEESERRGEGSSALPNPPVPGQFSVPAVPAPSSSTKDMEASLRARVLVSRRTIKPPQHASSTPGVRGSPAIPEAVTSPLPSGVPTPFVGMDDADSFIAQAVGVTAPTPPAPPPPPSRSTSTTQLQRLEQDITERKILMERLGSATTKAEREEALSLLREKDRASKESETTSAGATTMRPSAKLNLDYLPAPQPRRSLWPNHQHQTILVISDDEGEGEEDDDAGDL